MFETRAEADWSRVDAVIELACALARAEIRHRALRAMDDIDAILGLSEAKPESFYTRSLAQRIRHARARHTPGGIA